MLGERRGDLVAVDERVDRRDQVVPVTLLEQIRTDGLYRLHALVRLGGDAREVLPGELGELLAVGLVAERQIAQMQHEVVLEEFDVLGELHLGQPALRQHGVDTPVDFQPVGVVTHFVPPVRHRLHGGLLVDVPEVDLIGDQRDALGRKIGLGDKDQVLVEHSLGKEEIVLDEEFPAIALIGAQSVPDEQVRQFCDGFQRAGGGIQPGVPLVALLVPGVLVQPDGQPGNDIRPGFLRRLQHISARIEFQDVVAVQEHDVPALGVLDADVPRLASRTAVLRQLEGSDPPGMTGRELLRHFERTVGAAVVDDHHLDVPERLVQHGLDRGRQPVGVVVDDDDY